MPLPLRWFWKNYQYVLAFYFAIEEINRDLHLLPNLTLGFHIFNAFHSDHRTLETALLWLSGDTEFLPNYKCQTQSKAIGTLLELYKMPQVTYGTFDPMLSDTDQFLSLYPMAPKDSSLAHAMVSLLLHFGWTWVALFLSDDLKGEQFRRDLKAEMVKNGTCVALTEKLPVTKTMYGTGDITFMSRIRVSSANVHMLHGEARSLVTVDMAPGFFLTTGKVHPFLKNVRFTNSAGDHISLGEKSSQMAQYDIHNAVNFPAGLGLLVKVGEFVPRSPLGQGLVINEEMIEWPIGFTETPRSVCSQSCPPRFRKIPQEGRPVCCFACVFCPEGHISNQTAAVLGVFVKHRDTPIVKANNRALSSILLISLTFCFLCSLLFIGRPGTATCILQEATFGLVFTVAVSTVLAKTVTVILAFKVTAPGRRMRRCLVSGAPNFIIPSCSLIQLTLCGVWLGTSPPFVDTDTHSDHGHIIITCNKGSVTAFYCAL
ncbi:Hypothetical predicted protein [Marmota monax]|uniref:G-protein coupled receptors family 3 profile domain-containing protein n=1 Tax=Marmota monax TaxID=9995 RepID=A0A5E4BQX2_MARMO|nr:Hypothetical predicted protein [Marmota monax]